LRKPRRDRHGQVRLQPRYHVVKFVLIRGLEGFEAARAGERAYRGTAELEAAPGRPVRLGDDAGHLMARARYAAEEAAGDIGSAQENYTQLVHRILSRAGGNRGLS